ncbi:flagellar export chaperone FliS [Fusibacter ferrireducens]|uniref:Flagellar export chaperone FliS n=1 Tax=Fusibacter ferrireducens TaxID=2785058 RepID=A0ABR9ZVK0_9FIRM|nr:flagellar export chaperone FliS [Fusibacter ferrireducens]MBF4694497.1 flagellar export chaperone FliS [Fusibacter ferrireducens]
MAVMNPYNYSRPKKFINTNPVTFEPSEKKSENVIGNRTNQYLEQKIMAAKPEELTYMLYDGLVKFIKKAIIQLGNCNYQEVNYNCQRAQSIIDELRSTLNMDVELSYSLEQLYEYMGYKLVNANVDKDEKQFAEVLKMAESFKDTWKEAFNIKG